MTRQDLPEKYPFRTYKGEIEFEARDKNGNTVWIRNEPNLVKIFAKEMLAHRLPSTQVWNPQANTGLGAWEDSNIDPNQEFAARYVLLGASYDDNGVPLEFNDTRFYDLDTVTNSFIPVKLTVGATNEGDLINPIAITEPERPLKRVESISFENFYQPSGVPLLQDDVRAMDNVVVFETTIATDEYNGFGTTDSDYFTITEVALSGGRSFDNVGACECAPRELFLEGVGSTGTDDETSLLCSASGGSTISIDSSETDVDLIKEGDQIRIGPSTGALTNLNQVSPYYLVISKLVGGRDIQLDRAVVDSSNSPIVGQIGVYKDTLRLFSHRILSAPIRKTSDIELIVRWRIIFN